MVLQTVDKVKTSYVNKCKTKEILNSKRISFVFVEYGK